MKVQFSVYDALLASMILIIFYLILYYSFSISSEFDKKYIKFLSYDILFSIDKIYKIDVNYQNQNLISKIREILLTKLNRQPIFYIENYGLIPKEINISCICDNETLKTLNNLYRNVEVNGRFISINFFPTNFPLLQSDFENHGLIIWGCKDLSYTDLLRYREVNGILFLCDINSSYYDNYQTILSQIFNLEKSNNNGNPSAILLKPEYGYYATYKAYKILKYQFSMQEGTSLNLLTSNVVVKPRNSTMYLFRQANSEIAAIALSYYRNKIIGWSVDFYRDKNLDDTERKILLSLLLSIVSMKEPKVPNEAKSTLIPYVSYNFQKFLEPFIIYFSIY